MKTCFGMRFLKGPVIRATFFFNLSRNIIALQVKHIVAHITRFVINFSRNKIQCCRLRQHVAQIRLKLDSNFGFAALITTEASTCPATNLYLTLMIGFREAQQHGK